MVGASTGQGLKGQDMGPRGAGEVCGISEIPNWLSSMATTFGKQPVLSGLHSFDLLAGSLLRLERCTFAFRDKNGWQQIAEDAGVMAIEVEVSSPLDNNIYPHQKLCRPKMPSNLAKCTQYNPNQVPQETFPITSHYFQTSFTYPYLSPS